MPDLRGERVVLRPLRESDVARVRAIASTPEVARWWGRPDDEFPLADDPGTTRFVILADREIVGLVQYGEEQEPDFRHAWIDVFVDPAHHGHGLGTDAVRTLFEHLVAQRGHHRVTIDPACENAPAIRSYEKAGFRPVGTLRSAWRDPEGRWRDVLLMEQVRI
jgi:aminoglycoside 6'-N-acetyltransferase